MPDNAETEPTAPAPQHDSATAGNTLRVLLSRRRVRLLLGIFLLSLAVFLSTSTGQFRSIDDINLYQTTHSLTSGIPNVDVCKGTNQSADYLYARGPHGCVDFSQALLQKSYRKASDGKYVSKYGIGVPIVAAPFFGAGRVASGVFADDPVGHCRGRGAIACCRGLLGNADVFRANCQGDTRDMVVQTSTLFTNSLVTAITLIIVMIVSLQLGASFPGAALIGLVFGFGSYAFAYAKTLGAEPGTAMCVILAVMFGIEAVRTSSTKAVLASGVAAGAAVWFRSTALVFLPILGVWFLATFNKDGWRAALRRAAVFSLGVIVMVLLLLLVNQWRYGTWKVFGYNQSTSRINALPAGGSIATGLWGQWLSPGKSIFLYAPFVLLAIAGLVVSVRKYPRELALLLGVVMGNTLLFGRVRFWSGDWAWGPRYMLIVLPCLAAMCAPVVNMRRWRNALVVLGGLGLLFPGLLGVAVNFNIFYRRANQSLGATFRNTVYHDWSWNPIWHHLKIFGQQWGNFGQPYGLLYSKGQPRFDIWWMDDRWWILDHSRRVLAAMLMLSVIAGLAISGAVILRNTLRQPVAPAWSEVSSDVDASRETAVEHAPSGLET